MPPRVQAFEFLDPIESPVLRLLRASVSADQIVHAAENDSEWHDITRRAGPRSAVVDESQHLHAKQHLAKDHQRGRVFGRSWSGLHCDAFRPQERFHVRFGRASPPMTHRRADFPFQLCKRSGAGCRARVA
ncbi:MAG: hypothetical protein WBE80_00985 [Methylocella sp.]